MIVSLRKRPPTNKKTLNVELFLYNDPTAIKIAGNRLRFARAVTSYFAGR